MATLSPQLRRVGPAPGELLKEARLRRGVSQELLAARAGTTQSAISRIESGRVSPSVDTLWELLYLLGEDLELSAGPRDSGIDATLNRNNLSFAPAHRVQRGLAFSDFVRRNRGKRPGDLEAWGHVDGPPPLQAHPLLKALVEHGVDFVLVGGLAGIALGSSYPTYDVDVAYSRDEANLERMARALKALRVSLRVQGGAPDLPFLADARSLANGANFTFMTEFGMFDILGDLEGIRSYDELRRDAKVLEVEGFPIRVTSIAHLISMKRAASRTKDKLMLEEYIVIADEQKNLGQEEKERRKD
ncbi:MAG TPA: helix-turn-helix transcriptional regulator [Solirubrobacterales bacterium]|nr:helix-turn-helix transcriptional regulator [Solirubrobacterales bacterium]